MLEVTASGPVLYVKLNRPEVRNAFNDELIAALTTTFLKVGPESRAVVLSGEGRAFSAGQDLDEAAAMDAVEKGEDNVRAPRNGNARDHVRRLFSIAPASTSH